MHSHERKLFDTAEAGDMAGLQAVLAAGVDVHSGADLALRMAAQNGWLEAVQCLLDAGADVHTDGDYALRMAVENGHLDLVRCLLAAGADVHALNDHALCRATWLGHHDITWHLLAAGAAVEAREGAALLWSATNGHIPVVRLLLAYGASIQSIRTELHRLPQTAQVAALAFGEVDSLSPPELARQGICPEALCILLKRQGHAEIAAMLTATQILEPMAPEARVAAFMQLLATPTENTHVAP